MYTRSIYPRNAAKLKGKILCKKCKKRAKVSSGSVAWRLVKGIIFITCLALFLDQTVRFLRSYYKYPTTTEIELTHVVDFEPPAVTICNRNPLKRSKFCAVSNLCGSPKNITRFCKEYPFMCTDISSNLKFPKLPDNNVEFKKLVTAVQNIYTKELINQTVFEEWTWRNKDPDGWNSEMKPAVAQEVLLYYPCYTENLLWNHSTEIQKWHVGESFLSDPLFKYNLIIERSEQLFFQLEPTVFLSIHSPFDPINPLHEDNRLTLGNKYTIYIRVEEENRLQSPYQTNCTDYEDLWRKNNKTGPRSQKMCKHMCKLKVFETHKRVKFEFQMLEYPLDLDICFGKKCEYSLEGAELLKTCENNCKSNCRHLRYKIIRNEIEQENSRSKIDDHSIERDLIEVKIYLGDLEVFVENHVAVYDTGYLFSYIGGLMGCWLGVSVWAFAGIAENVFRSFRQWVHRVKNKRKIF